MAYDPLKLATTHLDSASRVVNADLSGALVLTRGALLRLAAVLSDASDHTPTEGPVLRVIGAARDLLDAVSDAHSQSLATDAAVAE